MPVKILPYVTTVQPNQPDKKPVFVSLIQKPKPKQRDAGSRIFFIK